MILFSSESVISQLPANEQHISDLSVHVQQHRSAEQNSSVINKFSTASMQIAGNIWEPAVFPQNETF